MVSTRAPKGIGILAAKVGLPSIATTIANLQNAQLIAREVVGIVGALTLVGAATLVWAQSAAAGKGRSADHFAVASIFLGR